MNTHYNIERLTIIEETLGPEGVLDEILVHESVKKKMMAELIEEIGQGGAIYSIRWKGMSNIPAQAELGGGLYVDSLMYSSPSCGIVIGPDDLEIGTYDILSPPTTGMVDRHILITLHPAYAEKVKLVTA